MRKKTTLFLLLLAGMCSTAIAAGVKVCLTNSFGEQSSLVFTPTGGGNYDVSGTYNYQIFGGTIWSVSGTFSTSTGHLHFVATNPDPHQCLDGWADYVTFDYRVTRTSISGQFSNDCDNAGSLTASAARGDCGYNPVKLNKGESGTTGSSKMTRSQRTLPSGDDLLKILAAPAPVASQNNSDVVAAGIPVCLTNSFGEQASLSATAAGGGKYNITGVYDYRPFGSTLWPVHGTYNGATRKLHFVAVNPNPDFCTFFADSVVFDYTVSGANNINGSFVNNCGVAGPLTASAARGSCGFAAVKMKQGEYGGTGSHKMNRTPVALPQGEDLQKILGENNSDVVQAGIPVCLTNSFGEQASLSATAAGGGKYNITGVYDYRPFGSTLWPVHGTYNGGTRKLHFVAVNPNPDFCTFFADSVVFDYTVSGANNINGSFVNNCGVAGPLTASATRGSCGFASVKMNQGEYGSTGSHKMHRTQVPLPQGEDLRKILGEKNDDVIAQAGIPVCLTNSFGEQASLSATAAGGGKYNITGVYDYRPFGSTLWPVHGTYNGATRKLHFVAVNPNPDFCTFFADSVVFDYTVSGANNINGSFVNNCGVAGPLTASATRGSCGFASVKMNKGEYGSTGSHKMHRTQIALPQGEDLAKILAERIITVSPNPASNSTQIAFTLNFKSNVTIQIYDQFGNLSRTLAKDVSLNDGKHTYTWNLKTDKGYAAQRGAYWIKVITNDGVMTQRLVVIY